MVVANGKRRNLTMHARRRVEERAVEREWIADVLNHWVAREWDEFHGSMNYYGFIEGHRRLFLVAVSASDEDIFTVHFDSGATRRYHRHMHGAPGLFDEVRDAPAS